MKFVHRVVDQFKLVYVGLAMHVRLRFGGHCSGEVSELHHFSCENNRESEGLCKKSLGCI